MRNIHRIKSQRRRNRMRRSRPAIPYLPSSEAPETQNGERDTVAGLSRGTVLLPDRAPALARTLRFSRIVFALFLIMHGLAHARAGSVLVDPAQSWRLFNGTVLGAIMVGITQALWAVSMLGFIAGGLGLLGVVTLRRYSQQLIIIAAMGSGMLLILAEKPYAIGGAVLDILLLTLIAASAIGRRHFDWLWHRTLLEELAPRRSGSGQHRITRRVGNAIAWTFLVYVAVLGAVRPWHRTWGATPRELSMRLPGDELAPRVVAMHGITIDAPASAVWPWLVQIGQDRGGFYSYTWVENGLLRAGIRNADRIHPEWQSLSEGDFVRSARTDWLGGRFADRTGWLVIDVEPQRSITLLGWGTFAVLPIDSERSRLLIRSRAGDVGFFSAPLEFLVLEPGHFLMERRMMLGIRERAERTLASTANRGG